MLHRLDKTGDKWDNMRQEDYQMDTPQTIEVYELVNDVEELIKAVFVATFNSYEEADTWIDSQPFPYMYYCKPQWS